MILRAFRANPHNSADFRPRSHRVTASLRRSDGGMIHVRKSTVAEPALTAIYDALGVNALPGGTRKLVC